MVFVYGYRGDFYGFTACAGTGFGVGFSEDVATEAESALEYRFPVRGGDNEPTTLPPVQLTAQVAEFARAFDALAAKQYADSVPRRAAVPSEPATGEYVLALVGLWTACVMVFFLSHLGFVAAGRWRRRDRARQRQWARLGRIGDCLVSVDPGGPRQAEVARQYVLALQAYETGADVGGEVERLEWTIDNAGAERGGRIL
ncbi:hypothetical protein [Kibdelosporangium phytohabitans]|uniref:Uncharacterized protein n=1 Tax=Kibdelosporangium phytohabitans TaxID=860235 RepID=A0A0N9IBM8_9PSEU|nr:hypothetical protein [Kibdelosporangium phytohabitans]ALG13721.1 hypothetical protein AOZ06_48785 [Kibdelosporangium phytohabitans]MBE1465612.1 hypothetical protein [Kibdelosporangium phytohabitans]